MAGEYEKVLEKARLQKGLVARYQIDVSDESINYYIKSGKLERLRRGIYRVQQFPVSDDEDFVEAYLWAKEEAIFSHQTALSIHNLSDLLPNRIHFTLPADKASQNRQIPDVYEVYYADLSRDDWEWHDVLPVTTIERTLKDLMIAGINPDEMEKALDQAKTEGLVSGRIERKLIRHVLTHRR